MYKKCLFICCLWGLISCGEKRPKGILSEQKMRDVWVDLSLAKSSLPYRTTVPSIKRGPNQAEALYAYVLKKNGITRSDFENSNRYYTKHTQAYVKIMKAVLDSIERLKNEIDQRVRTREDYLKAQERFRENRLPCVFCEPPRLPLEPGLTRVAS